MRRLLDDVRAGMWYRAHCIRVDVAYDRAEPDTVAYAVQNFRLAWADLLERLSGWAQ